MLKHAVIIDNHFASLGTSLEGHLNLDTLAEDLENEKATESFFGGTPVQASPTKHHVPVIGEEGFVDRREGLEDWPELCHIKEENINGYGFAASENHLLQHGKTAVQLNIGEVRPILQPKSQKNKVRSRDRYSPRCYTDPLATVAAPVVQPVQSPVRPPRPLSICKKDKSLSRANHRYGPPTHRVAKRGARDSSLTKFTVIADRSDCRFSTAPFLCSSLTFSRLRYHPPYN